MCPIALLYTFYPWFSNSKGTESQAIKPKNPYIQNNLIRKCLTETIWASFGHTCLYHLIDPPLTLLADQKAFTISTPIGTFTVDKRKVFAKYFSPLLYFGAFGLKRILEHKRSPEAPTNTGFVVLAFTDFFCNSRPTAFFLYIKK